MTSSTSNGAPIAGRDNVSVEIVVVGTSLGGLDALKVLLSGLPPSFDLPIVIVQHRSKQSDEALVKLLSTETSLPVTEANDKDVIERGRVYCAPADYHLLVEPGRFALSIDAPVNYSRPSIDVLFESAADTYGAQVVGVLLTGASKDGAIGCARIKACGGVTLVQDPATALAQTMPAAAISAQAADHVLPLTDIPLALVQLCGSMRHSKHE